jgi:hypothetical protein
LTKLDKTQNPIRQVSDNTDIEQEGECDAPASSIVFLKSQRTRLPLANDVADFAPLRLSHDTDLHSSWLDRESRFVRPVTFTEVAPPTQLGFMQAQPAPAYGQLFQKPNQQAAPMPHPGYTAASGMNSAWNAYYGAASQQMPAQSPQYQSLTQLGGMMPVMAGQGLQPMMQPPMQTPGYGMQPAMPQQTIGYILLYPQAGKSGVNMQLASQHGQSEDGSDANDGASEAKAATDPNTVNWNGMQMQATFIPAQQMPQMPMQNPMMGGMNPYMMNPMMGGMNPYMMNPMMGGMNPYMMNPMMMGMNPYMMNPMMMGMGGMMPPIIIQMPADSGGRRGGGGGLFARLRAARQQQSQQTQAANQQAGQSLASLFTQPNPMPAKAAYPYGYFGATASPQQSGNFGGYHDMSTQTVRYPGM